MSSTTSITGQEMYRWSNILCWTARMFSLRRLVLKGMPQIARAKTGALLVKETSSVLISATLFFKNTAGSSEHETVFAEERTVTQRTSKICQLALVSSSPWRTLLNSPFWKYPSLLFQNLYLWSTTWCFTIFLRVVRQSGFVIGGVACCGIWWLQYAG